MPESPRPYRLPRPGLAESVVDIWRVELATAEGGICARGLLRVLLGRYLACDPRALSFVIGPHGKPALRGREPIGFNMSHSGSLVLYAFTAGTPVGIDVEMLDRRVRGSDYVALASRAFGPDCARRLAALDPEARRLEFLRAWVRHEAVLKCRGSGLLATRRADVTGSIAASGPSEPWVSELDLGPLALAAVAVEGGPRELRHRDWRPRSPAETPLPPQAS